MYHNKIQIPNLKHKCTMWELHGTLHFNVYICFNVYLSMMFFMYRYKMVLHIISYNTLFGSNNIS